MYKTLYSVHISLISSVCNQMSEWKHWKDIFKYNFLPFHFWGNLLNKMLELYPWYIQNRDLYLAVFRTLKQNVKFPYEGFSQTAMVHHICSQTDLLFIYLFFWWDRTQLTLEVEIMLFTCREWKNVTIRRSWNRCGRRYLRKGCENKDWEWEPWKTNE